MLYLWLCYGLFIPDGGLDPATHGAQMEDRFYNNKSFQVRIYLNIFNRNRTFSIEGMLFVKINFLCFIMILCAK